MTQERTNDSNKLIAEFMGLITVDRTYPSSFTLLPEEVKKVGITDWKWKDFMSQLQYHYSWDWLMPVVDKIESLFFNVVIESHITLRIKPQCYIYSATERFEMKPLQRDKKIDAVYEAVVEFIKWHNKQVSSNT